MLEPKYTQAEIPEHIKRQAKAQGAVSKAIREGVLVRLEVCELCGSIPGIAAHAQIVAHHWRGYEGDAATDVWFIDASCNMILRGKKYHNGSVSKDEARAIVLKVKNKRDWERRFRQVKDARESLRIMWLLGLYRSF